MKKKLIKKNNRIYLVVKGKKRHQVSVREKYLINDGQIQGLLPFVEEKRKESSVLYYDVTGHVTLKKLLAKKINKETLLFMLQEILDILKFIQGMFIDQRMLMLDIDNVYVSIDTQKLMFICVPIEPLEMEFSLKDFLSSIAKYAKFSKEEECGYMQELLQIINQGINFSLFELEAYVGKLYENVSEQGMKCEKCGTFAKSGATLCICCGNVLRVNKDKEEFSMAYIQNQVTKEQIAINKPVFQVGSASENNFCLQNQAVSRKHAVFKMEGGHYYVMDMMSKNGTTVNGRYIKSNIWMEIFPGDVILIADERFTFCIKQ